MFGFQPVNRYASVCILRCTIFPNWLHCPCFISHASFYILFVNAPMLLTDDDRLPTPIAEELDRLKPKKIVVLGGPALTSAFADELSARDVMCIGCTPGQPPEWYADRGAMAVSDGAAALKQGA